MRPAGPSIHSTLCRWWCPCSTRSAPCSASTRRTAPESTRRFCQCSLPPRAAPRRTGGGGLAAPPEVPVHEAEQAFAGEFRDAGLGQGTEVGIGQVREDEHSRAADEDAGEEDERAADQHLKRGGEERRI